MRETINHESSGPMPVDQPASMSAQQLAYQTMQAAVLAAKRETDGKAMDRAIGRLHGSRKWSIGAAVVGASILLSGCADLPKPTGFETYANEQWRSKWDDRNRWSGGGP